MTIDYEALPTCRFCGTQHPAGLPCEDFDPDIPHLGDRELAAAANEGCP